MICELGAGEVVSQNVLKACAVSAHYCCSNLAETHSVTPACAMQGE